MPFVVEKDANTNWEVVYLACFRELHTLSQIIKIINKRGKALLLYGFTQLLHQLLVVVKIVYGVEARTKDLLDDLEITPAASA